jgi:Kef-type K+ transport system membrane component KefB
MLEIAAVLVTLTALFSYLNYRFLKLPSPVGVMTVSLLLSLLLLLIGMSSAEIQAQAKYLVESIDFDTVLLNGMLSFLLFAGALHVNLSDLIRFRWAIGLLATVGVLASTFLIGGLCWLIFDGLLGLHVPLIYWLLLGAILSPTDPIAVLSILKSARAPPDLEIKIVGESLFNDGVAVVVFLILFELITGGEDLNGGEILILFIQEVAGGLLLASPWRSAASSPSHSRVSALMISVSSSSSGAGSSSSCSSWSSWSKSSSSAASPSSSSASCSAASWSCSSVGCAGSEAASSSGGRTSVLSSPSMSERKSSPS